MRWEEEEGEEEEEEWEGVGCRGRRRGASV